MSKIDSILQPFQRFGVHLGLERIQKLLANLGNPHDQVPVIHVAGTNGKGSVCAYLSSILTAAGYRTGRYTSPHLVDWTERICLNEQQISLEDFGKLLLQVKAAISADEESPTQFEVITAAAWLYFAQAKVDVAVVEVGLGGRLDATNVCNPRVTIITSISRDHWQQLGSTVAEIAAEKAGILKAGCPVVIAPMSEDAQKVISDRARQLQCPCVTPQSARQIAPGWAEYEKIRYPLPLEGKIQLMNSALAIAALELLQKQGWLVSEEAIVNGMGKTKWLGRMQWTAWNQHKLLLDGAHNPAAAKALRDYVDTLNAQAVSWVMGMLSTKDHVEIFQALLRPKDRLYLVPVPDHSSANPSELASWAQNIHPELNFCGTYEDLSSALAAATDSTENLVVLCGSLYLVGHFLRTAEPGNKFPGS